MFFFNRTTQTEAGGIGDGYLWQENHDGYLISCQCLIFVCMSPQGPPSSLSSSLLCSLPLWVITLRCHAIFPTKTKRPPRRFYIGWNRMRALKCLYCHPSQRATADVLNVWTTISTLKTCPYSWRPSSGPTEGSTCASSLSSTQRLADATGSKEIRCRCWYVVNMRIDGMN